eukprot:6186427-Pleurochrysis_carterae.AAC.2
MTAPRKPKRKAGVASKHDNGANDASQRRSGLSSRVRQIPWGCRAQWRRRQQAGADAPATATALRTRPPARRTRRWHSAVRPPATERTPAQMDELPIERQELRAKHN